MPRQSRGPHLWLDKDRDQWTIIDRKRRTRTGFTSAQLSQAEGALTDYLTDKHAPAVKDDNPPLADLLKAYLVEHLHQIPSGSNTEYNVRNLAKWWGLKRLAEVTAANCIAYAETKNRPGARNDLKVLRSAINHWHKFHGPLKAIPPVILPGASAPRERYLTRTEAAKLLAAARHTARLARFIVIGWHTGSRSNNIFGLRWDMIDFKTGMMQRRAAGVAQAHKRTPPVRVSARLLAHLRRWKRIDAAELAAANEIRAATGEPLLKPCPYVVHWQFKKISKLQKTWPKAVEAAELGDDVTPHVLRHSRVTHLLRNGISIWDTAKAVGMTAEMVERVYGHHHPDWQKGSSQVH
jgi:integrase